MGELSPIWLGAIGGLLPDVIRIATAGKEAPPDYLKRPFFWLSLVLLAGLGALAAYLTQTPGTVANLAIGYSAPAILSRLLSRSDPPPSSGGRESAARPAETESLRRWWSR